MVVETQVPCHLQPPIIFVSISDEGWQWLHSASFCARLSRTAIFHQTDEHSAFCLSEPNSSCFKHHKTIPKVTMSEATVPPARFKNPDSMAEDPPGHLSRLRSDPTWPQHLLHRARVHPRQHPALSTKG